MNFDLGDRATLIAHGNHISRGGDPDQDLVHTSTYPLGNSATVDLGSNYWFDDGTPVLLDSLIHDGNDDPEIHIIVNYNPILSEPVPAKKTSFGGVKSHFR